MTCRKAAASMGCSGLASCAPTRPGSEPSARAAVSATLATVLLGRIWRAGYPRLSSRGSSPGRSDGLPHDLWVAPRHRLDLSEGVALPGEDGDRAGPAVLAGRRHPAEPAVIESEAPQ